MIVRVSGQQDHEHDRSRWIQVTLIAVYGALILACWAYRERLAALAPSLYGVNPTALVVLLGGYPIFRSAISALFKFKISADLAVAIAAAAALAIGEYLAAAEVIFIMLVGGALEDLALGRTERSIRQIVEMLPRKARVRRDGTECEVPLEHVRTGDILIVRPGERIPADGKIISGRASISEATITGEPLPADKGPGNGVKRRSNAGDRSGRHRDGRCDHRTHAREDAARGQG